MVMDNVDTLEYHRLIVGNDEAEYEATTTISEYIAMRAAKHANKLGLGRKVVKDFEIIKDAFSEDWVIVYGCERK
jgi:hypothetical protein